MDRKWLTFQGGCCQRRSTEGSAEEGEKGQVSGGGTEGRGVGWAWLWRTECTGLRLWLVMVTRENFTVFLGIWGSMSVRVQPGM